MSSLVFRSGTMNSGKSAHLLLTYHSLVSSGKKVMVFKPSTDSRDGGEVVTRAFDARVDAILIGSMDLNKIYRTVRDERPDFILIDEVQFFNEAVIDELGHIADDFETKVVCYGLKTDFQKNLFSGSKRLIEIGATLEDLNSVCVNCKRYAVYNMRTSNGVPIFDGEQIQTGGNESYTAVCRKCYEKAKTEIMFNGKDYLHR